MSTGLIALLDDVASIAKVAASSVDDIAGQAVKAGAKSAGVVIDDAAVTPRYVVGFAADRELPIVAKIAWGSIRNKLLFLLPAALALSFLAPWAITPLLMLGGAFLCYEGAEKIYEALFPHQAHAHEAQLTQSPIGPQDLEDQKVASAIKTDFILSAEIMAITLSAIPEGGLFVQAAVLAIVGIGITLVVYGAVALIVKADDFGLALAGNTSSGTVGKLVRAIGSGIVRSMPFLLKTLAVVGTAAMIWVGGGIIIHGLESFGLAGIAHVIHDLAEALSGSSGAIQWIVGATGAGLIGLLIGAALIPLVGHVLVPVWTRIMNRRK